MRLFHFSDRGTIRAFHPRPVAQPSARKPGMDWLNGPLVWAIDDVHQPLYLFPRECPRIVAWPVESTTAEDWTAWTGGTTARMVGFIERDWADTFREAAIFRYELPTRGFQPLRDAGMWVSEGTVEPTAVEAIRDLPAALKAQGVDLRVVADLGAFRGLRSSTLHASGIRLRNSKSWTAA